MLKEYNFELIASLSCLVYLPMILYWKYYMHSLRCLYYNNSNWNCCKM